jgi:hypothetical protein
MQDRFWGQLRYEKMLRPRFRSVLELLEYVEMAGTEELLWYL